MFDVRVSFSEPGEYVIRGMALDGVLWTDQDVAVTVTVDGVKR